VKDFMRDYGKIAGFAGAGAFLLSLGVGLVSRNPVAVALTRAVVLSILFAGLGAAARFVVMKYLPEVAAAQPSAGEAPSGQAIDITLPEESPAAAARASAYRRSQAEAPGDTEVSDAGLAEADMSAPGEVLGLDEPPSPEGAVAGGDLDDLLPPLTDTGSAAGSGESEGEDSVEEAESVSEEGPGETSEQPGRGTLETEPDDLGKLPDISNLGIADASPGSSRSARAGLPRPRGGRAGLPPTPADEVKGALGSQDPSTLARAIRTILKRDEKG
jgi:hypothetical protein